MIDDLLELGGCLFWLAGPQISKPTEIGRIERVRGKRKLPQLIGAHRLQKFYGLQRPVGAELDCRSQRWQSVSLSERIVGRIFVDAVDDSSRFRFPAQQREGQSCGGSD